MMKRTAQTTMIKATTITAYRRARADRNLDTEADSIGPSPWTAGPRREAAVDMSSRGRSPAPERRVDGNRINSPITALR